MATPALNDALIHYAMSYNGADEYVGGILPFLTGGLASGEPTLVLVPRPNMELLRGALGGAGDRVTFLDMVDLGRNPARIIPRARRFAAAHPGRRIRIVGEPIWAERSEAEIREAIRHEACVNILFADVAATVLCPYDAARLGPAVLTAADRTHPHRVQDGEYRPSSRYAEPAVTLSMWDDLSAVPGGPAETLDFHHRKDLATLRSHVQDRASRAGLSEEQVQDLLIAVNEVASNTLGHTGEPGTLRTWWDTGALVCEVSDHGHLPDPLVGRLEPPTDAGRGRGLWIANQICDLVELRTGASGTVTRMHVATSRTGR